MDSQLLYNRLENCDICPRDCFVNRFEGEEGTCGSGSKIEISSYGPHYGEEPEIVGLTSSGTIFLTGCSLLCNFCQNYDISHMRSGRKVGERELVDIMLKLQEFRSSNINLVTPTHYSPQLIRALEKAKVKGLTIPVVYNSSGYEKVDTLKYWEGIADIYMPDLKFMDSAKSKLYADAEDYFEYAAKAIKEMHRQAGDLLIINETAVKGLLIRHLVMPNNQSDSKEIIDFIAEEIGNDTYLNLMEQYHPCYRSMEFGEIGRSINAGEYNEVVEYARSKGFTRPSYIFQNTQNII